MSWSFSLLREAATKVGMLRLALYARRSPPLILMYHGVSREKPSGGLRNCEGKHIAVDQFVRHLRMLGRSHKVIPLSDMVEGLRSGLDMRGTVSITFDDGYENNASVAAPVLSDFRMTASFFVTTGFIGTGRCIWTDRLEIALDRTRAHSLRMPGEKELLPIRSLPEKRHALRMLKTYLKTQPSGDLDSIVDELTAGLGSRGIGPEGDYRFMNWNQVRELVAAGFEVGAHTVSHPILTKIPFDEAAAEILESRDAIVRETGTCSSTFCFPNGKSSDFSTELKDLCRTHFTAALSTERGRAIAEQIFELRRLSPSGEGKGENFEWMLLRAR